MRLRPLLRAEFDFISRHRGRVLAAFGRFWGIRIHLFLLVWAVLGINRTDAADSVSPLGQRQGEGRRYRPDRVLVLPKDSSTLTRQSLPKDRRGRRVLKRFSNAGNIELLQLAPNETVRQAINDLMQSGEVEFAEPDYTLRAAVSPDDPSFTTGTQWSLHNTGSSGGRADADIDAPEGWETLNDASAVVVAIIDTGVRYTHEDLAENMWVNPREIAGNKIDDDSNGFIDDVHGINAIANSGDPLDDNGHGTHIAGIVGAVGNNGKGITGVAWKVRLMALKFLNSAGDGDTSDAIQCVDYARRNGARVINASWGSPDLTLSLQTAINNARNAGIVFVAAAGNDASDNDATPLYPASFNLDNIVAVTATTRSDLLDATFSNYGAASVDLGAPGAAIYSTWFSSDSSYLFLSGTSMAAPHVTGALALMRARFTNDSPKQLIDRLLAATDPLSSLAGKCVTGGRLNLSKSIGPGLLADFTASRTVGPLPLTVDFRDQSYGEVLGWKWSFGDNTATSAEQNPTHVFNEEGEFEVTLTITGTNGLTAVKTRPITVIANYQFRAAPFNWIEATNMPRLILADNAVSPAQEIPFPFSFYGQTYRQLYVGANGVIGFTSQGLTTDNNTDIPNAGIPNGLICPYWDDLNPGRGGTVRIGVEGEAPSRKLVVSWLGVPRVTTTNQMTFQAILHEGSHQILYQYLDVAPATQRGGGRRATVGVENETGLIAAKHGYNGNPRALTNLQAILFSPGSSGGMSITPEEDFEVAGPIGGPFAPLQKSYTIHNTGSVPLDWQALASELWLKLSLTNGLLEPGATTNILVDFLPPLPDLSLGFYSAQVRFINRNNGRGNSTRAANLSVEGLNARLQVSPERAFTPAGPVGGPFSPSSEVYTLVNAGDATLHYAIAADQEWIELSARQGRLRPGESAVVRLSLNTAAAQLGSGTYPASVTFSNTTSGAGNADRAVSLLVTPLLRLTSAAATPEAFAFSLQTEPGITFVIEASTNLVDWLPVSTNTPSTTVFNFAEPGVPVEPVRFYRAKIQP